MKKRIISVAGCVFMLIVLMFGIFKIYSHISEKNAIPDIENMRKDLETLTTKHRPIGSEGEKEAAGYLEQRFEKMGYEVTLQPYTNAEGQTGTNVIAVKHADKEKADILVISAHHDSVPTAYGANDNASGVVALLALAEAVKDRSFDIELRFISFTDEENGRNGSRYYTETLTESELQRMTGDIQLDMLGGLGTDGLNVCTMDGEANWLSRLIMAEDDTLNLITETASDHAAFQHAGVPAVLVTQNGRGYLYHSVADTAGHIELSDISRAVTLLLTVIDNITSAKDTGYLNPSENKENDYVYTQTLGNVIYFGVSLAESEAYIGAAGELVDSYVITGDFWEDKYETYLYKMKWFGSDKPMNTYYLYRNGFLEYIEIKPEETGCTTDEVRKLIRGMYGEPSEEIALEDGALYESWMDVVYSKYIMLDAGEKCVITVYNYSAGYSNILGSYHVSDGNVSIDDDGHAAVWEYLCEVLPYEARERISEFNLFTDGFSNNLAYASTISREDGTEDNSQFAINIDYYDVYDENGNKRDWSKLTYTIIHEYGHILLEDDTQIDLTVGKNVHDPVGFVEGSFRKRYYDLFWKDEEDGRHISYKDDPTRYVRPYAAGYFHEDMADTFAIFVFSNKPQGNTVAEQKILFFWEDAGMLDIRSEIRTNLGLE